MKRKLLRLGRYLPWLLLLLAVNGFAALLLWLADAAAFRALSASILLTSLLLFAAVLAVLGRIEDKKERAFREFINNPDEWREEALLKTVSASEAEAIRLLGDSLRQMRQTCSDMQAELCDYEEYVEAWAHETKTPLSLLSLLLDNRGGELPDGLRLKLDYVRAGLQENVDRMLYYARLKSVRKDHLFESINIRECIDEVLEDYAPLLEEKGFRVKNEAPPARLFTDRRGIRFILAQVVGNSVKYCSAEPELRIWLVQDSVSDTLVISDNGRGVSKSDLPFIFEKGFTGDSAELRKKATGMGLYLAKKMAAELGLSLSAASEYGAGFEMRIAFPRV